MKQLSQKLKRTAVALVTAVALAGGSPAGEAYAFNFNPGDLVLAMYGNGTEWLQNLGTINAQTAITNNQFNVSTGFAAAGGVNQVKYALVGYQTDFTTMVSGSSATAAGTVASLAGYNSALAVWSVFVNPPGNTILSSDINSFTNAFQPDAPSLGGNFAQDQFGTLGGGLLHILSDDAFNQVGFTEIGTAVLALNELGQNILTINPAAVPLPAAVWLFGTGVVGLAAIARRSRHVASN